jgi:amino acid adenylation domain-containing protein
MQNAHVEGFQLSPQQRRLWVLHADRGDTPYTATCTVRIRGSLAVPVLQDVLERAAGRHEILRTTFYASHEMSMPVQVIGDTGPSLDVRDLTGMDPAEQARLVEGHREQTAGRAFDFAEGPLTRACLMKLSEREQVLLLHMPALCCDAQGLNNLVAEICLLYEATIRGDDVSNDVLQYVDASTWLNDALSSEESIIGRQFWQSGDFLPVVEHRIAFERRDANGGSFAPRRVPVNLRGASLPRASSLIPGHDVSIDVFLLTCWEYLLQRTIGDYRVAVGYVSNGRAYAELADAIGSFARCVPLAGDLSEARPFREALLQVDDTVRAANQWSDCFDWSLVSASLDMRRGAPYAACAYEHRTRTVRHTAPGLEWTVQTTDACIDRFRIKLVSCREPDDSVTAVLEYDASLYREEDVRRLAEQYATVIEEAVRAPDTSLGSLRILPESQRDELITTFSGGGTPFPAECVHRLFENQAARTPHAVAVVCESERLTYAELNARANQVAHYLRKRDVGPDVRVALCLERSVASVVGILGILKAGGAYVPLDPQWPTSRLALMIDESGAPIVLTQTHAFAGTATSAEVVLLDRDAERIASEPTGNIAAGARPEHLVYVMFTSGSTGRPKGVCVEHRQLANYIRGVVTGLELPPAARFATVTTLAADLGNTAIYPALVTGGCLHILTETCASDPEAFAEYFDRHSIDVLKIVPSHLKALLSCSAPERILPKQRLVLGGEACPWDLVDHVRRIAPACAVFNHYGPTETTVGATTWRVTDDDARACARTVPIGRPLPHVKTFVLDRYQEPVPLWVAGELYIGGACVARGYLNASELSAVKFVADPFSFEPDARLYRTGDLVRLLPTGALEFLGRIDDQIKVRGFRVELGEIEAALRRHPAVLDAAVLVREQGGDGQQLAAFVVGSDRARPETPELIAFLRRELAKYMVPAVITAIDALPLTANGKVNRQALLTLLDVPSEPTSLSEQPSTPWETMVAGVWRDILKTDQVSVDDNFYDLGGHSLIAIQVVTAIEKRTGLNISPRDLVFHTLRQFAALCESRVATVRNPSSLEA